MKSYDGSSDWFHHPEYWHLDDNERIVIHDDAPQYIKDSYARFRESTPEE